MNPNTQGIQNLDPRTLSLPDHPSRRVRTEAEWQNLTESIRTHGILQPVIVRPMADGRYQVVSGVGRVVVARKLGLATVPVVEKSLTDEQAVLLAGDDNRSQGRWHFLNDILECKELRRINGNTWKQRVLAGRFRVSLNLIKYWLRIADNLPDPTMELAIEIASKGPQEIKDPQEKAQKAQNFVPFSLNSAKFSRSKLYWELTQEMLYEASRLGNKANSFLLFCVSRRLDRADVISAAEWAQKNNLSDWKPISTVPPPSAPVVPSVVAPVPVPTPAAVPTSPPPAPVAPPSATVSTQPDPKAEYRAKLAEFLKTPIAATPVIVPTGQPPAAPALVAPTPAAPAAAPPSADVLAQQEAKMKYRAMLEEWLKPLRAQPAPVVAPPPPLNAAPVASPSPQAPSPALSRKEVWISRAIGAGIVAALALGIWSNVLNVGWFAKSLLWIALAGGTAGWYRLPVGFRESAARLSLRAARFAGAKAAPAFRFIGLKLQEGWRSHPWWMCAGVLSGLVTIGLWVTARPLVFLLWGLALVSALVWTLEERGRAPAALRRA